MAGRAKAQNDWQKENRDRINLTVPKGQKEVVQAHAAAHNDSTTAFIKRAISETMARDQDIDKMEEQIKNIVAEGGSLVENTRVHAEIMSAINTLRPFITDIEDLYISSISPKPQPHKPKLGGYVTDLNTGIRRPIYTSPSDTPPTDRH